MKIQRLKNMVVGFYLTVLYMGLTSCERSTTSDSKEVAEKHNEAKFEKADEKDAQFLVDIAEMNLSDIQLGQLAQERGLLVEVRDLGKSVEGERSRVQASLKKLASKKTITIPTIITRKGQGEFQKMLDKNGKHFDKAYCDRTVDVYKTTIDKFEANISSGKDKDIRDWSISMLPSLRSRLDHALICQATCAKQK